MKVLRVLHVDDEADIREVVEISLRLDPGIVTLCCASGQEALEKAAKWSPDILLLDVMMPAMDGPATLKFLRENPKTADIPVVFMTARAQSSEIKSLEELGAVGVISKPFDPMNLAALVRGYVRSPENRLGEMRNEFRSRLDRDLVKLAKYSSILSSSTKAADVLDGIREVAHSLAGAAGIFGFEEISVSAARLEESVISMRKGSGSQADVEQAIAVLKAQAVNVHCEDATYQGST